MKRILLFSALFSGSVLCTKAQMLTPEVFASAGDYYTASWGSLSWTAGESVVEIFSSGSYILTQGFQQPENLSATAVINVLSFPIGVNETKSFEFTLMVGQTNSGPVDGMSFQLSTPSLGAGFVNAAVVGSVPASASGAEIISASGVPTGGFVKVTTTAGWVQISGVIKNTSNAGTVQLLFKSLDAAETSTIYKGSFVLARLF